MIRMVVAHPYPLFRQGLCSLFTSTEDILIVGEADKPALMLRLVRQHCPDVVLSDARLSPLSSDQSATRTMLNLVTHLRQDGARGIFLLAPSVDPLEEEELFQLLKFGVNAYEPPTLSGQALVEKIRQVARGEFLLTSAMLSPEMADAYGQGEWSDETDNPGQGPVEDIPQKHKQSRADFNLTKREVAILREIMRGYSNKQIAATFGIHDQTVKNHITSILKKTHRPDRTAAVVLALSLNLLSLEEANLVTDELYERKQYRKTEA